VVHGGGCVAQVCSLVFVINNRHVYGPPGLRADFMLQGGDFTAGNGTGKE
jgi:hypothetical protein